MKKARVLFSLVLAIGIVGSSFSFASAATPIDAGATRYRLPLIKFELPVFRNGVLIDDKASPSKLRTDAPKKNGTLFKAYVDKYDALGSSNKALHVQMMNDPTTAEEFLGFKLVPHADIGSNQKPLDGKDGIASNSSDHGIMFYADASNLVWHNDQVNPVEHYEPYQKDIKIVWQDFDKNADGTDVLNEEGAQVVTAWAAVPGKPITYVWTREIDVKATVDVLDENGEPIQEGGKNKQIEEHVKHSVGDVEVRPAYTGETIMLPPGFAGYVIVPFSSMAPTWNGEDVDGKVNLSKIDMANFYTGVWPYMKGDLWIDDYCFWGPRLAEASGAIDMGTGFKYTDYLTNKGVPVGTVNPGNSTDPNTSGSGTTGGTSGGTTGGTTGGSSSGGSANTGDNGIVWALWAVFGGAVLTGTTLVLKKKKA